MAGTVEQHVSGRKLGLDFTDAGTGTCTTNGTGHDYAEGDTCSVNVIFAPQYAGAPYGAVTLSDASGVIATRYIYGTGQGPQLAFEPGTITTGAGNGTAGFSGDGRAAASAELNYPEGAAVDGAADLYIAECWPR